MFHIFLIIQYAAEFVFYGKLTLNLVNLISEIE